MLRLDAREGAAWKIATESREGASSGTELTGVAQRGIWAQNSAIVSPHCPVPFRHPPHPTVLKLSKKKL